MKIVEIKYKQPQFELIGYDLDGMNFFQRTWFLLKTPVRFKIVTNWCLTAIFEDGSKIDFYVPSGFITDFASIHRVFWILPGFSPLGPLRIGAIIHDFGYQHGYLFCIVTEYVHKAYAKENQKVVQKIYVGEKQKVFDTFLKEIAEADNHAVITPVVAYYMLRLFGIFAWNKYRKHGPGAINSNSLDLSGVITDE